MYKHIQFFTLLILLSTSAQSAEVPGCGNTDNGYGPFNYITQKSKLKVVEEHHFTRSVEQLIKGKSGRIESDLDYTLRAFPNHHRALLSISRWERFQKRKIKGYLPRHFSAECYYKRAIVFAPNDDKVHLLFGIHLHKNKRFEAAENSYKIAISINSNLVEAYYNLGLTYIALKQPKKALIYAQKAYELGYPLPGLKNKLVKSGHWKEGEKPNDQHP